MAVNLQALKDEINSDPVGMGYPAFVEANDAAIANILNNIDGANPRTVDNYEISAADFVAATTYDAYDGLTAAETAYYDMIVGREMIRVTADTKVNWAGIGGSSKWATGDKATMDPRIAALMQREGSRAEEIADTLGQSSVTASDVANARNLP